MLKSQIRQRYVGVDIVEAAFWPAFIEEDAADYSRIQFVPPINILFNF